MKSFTEIDTFENLHNHVHDKRIMIHYDVFSRIRFFDEFKHVKYLIIRSHPLIVFQDIIPTQLVHFQADCVMYAEQIHAHLQLRSLIIGKLYMSPRYNFPQTLLSVQSALVIRELVSTTASEILINSDQSITSLPDSVFRDYACYVHLKRHVNEPKFTRIILNHECNEAYFLNKFADYTFDFIACRITHLTMHQCTTFDFRNRHVLSNLIKLKMIAFHGKIYDLPHSIRRLTLSQYNALIYRLWPNLEYLRLDSLTIDIDSDVNLNNIQTLILPRYQKSIVPMQATMHYIIGKQPIQ